MEEFNYIFTPVIFINLALIGAWAFYLYFKDDIYTLIQKDRRMLKWPGEEIDKYIHSKHPAFQKEKKNKEKFIQAGIDNNLYPICFIPIKISASLLISGIGLYFLVIKAVLPLGTSSAYRLIVILGLLAFIIPDLDLHFRKRHRIKAFERNMSTIMNMFLVCLDAGITFKEALFYVSKELKYSHPVISYELDHVYTSSNLLLDQRVAFSRLTYRVPSDSLRKMIIIVMQNINHGSSLRKALAHLANSAHHETMFELEKNAHRLPGILTIFTVIFTLPLLFIALFGPYLHSFENIIPKV